MHKRALVIMGSDSDLQIMKESCSTLEQFNIEFDVEICSAHRTPEMLHDILKDADAKYSTIIAGAGAAAHLPGVIASMVSVPVIGVPIDSTALDGIDALYSIVQMPGGIPVASMSIGKAGAVNAAVYSAKIISLFNDDVRSKYNDYRNGLKDKVIKKNQRLKENGWKNY